MFFIFVYDLFEFFFLVECVRLMLRFFVCVCVCVFRLWTYSWQHHLLKKSLVFPRVISAALSFCVNLFLGLLFSSSNTTLSWGDGWTNEQRVHSLGFLSHLQWQNSLKKIPSTEDPGRLQSMGSQGVTVSGTVARQAPLSMGSPRHEYWSGLPFPPPGDLPDPDIEPLSLVSPALTGGFFTTWATWEALRRGGTGLPTVYLRCPFFLSQPHSPVSFLRARMVTFLSVSPAQSLSQRGCSVIFIE